MAVRTKTRRRRARRSNPRGVGTLVLNPRRRRRSGARRSRATSRRSNRRRTNRRHRSRARSRRSAMVANPRRRRSRRRFARRRNSLVINPGRRRRSRRRAPSVVYKLRSNGRRRRRNGRRRSHYAYRNPGVGALSRIPVLGGFLSGVMGLVAPAGFGAISVEPILLAAKYLGGYLPEMNSGLFYALMGVGVGAAIKALPLGSPELRSKLAIAAASAGAGIGYYKFRTGSDGDMAGELGNLPTWGDGYAVVPFGEASESGVGDVLVADYAGIPYTLGDVLVAPPDLSGVELGAAYAGPYAWRNQFPKIRPVMRRGGPPVPPGFPQPSPAAGVEGVQWGWLARLLGPRRFDQFTRLPPGQRQRALMAIKERTLKAASEILNGRAPSLAEQQSLGSLIVGLPA